MNPAAHHHRFSIHRLPAPAYVVRWRGYALKFHSNICGRVYSAVRDAEATLFQSPALAAARAAAHSVPSADMRIEPLTTAN